MGKSSVFVAVFTPQINSFIEFIRNVLTWQPGADERGAQVLAQLQIFAHIILVFQLNLREFYGIPQQVTWVKKILKDPIYAWKKILKIQIHQPFFDRMFKIKWRLSMYTQSPLFREPSK